MLRSHYSQEILDLEPDSNVELCGWVDARRDHGGIVFFDLRDREGIVQIVADPSKQNLELVKDIRLEYCLQIKGRISQRPEGTTNDDLPTGQLEVIADEVNVLNKCEPLPFQLDKADNVDEQIRYQYRYLDIRRPRLQNNLRIRAKVNASIRESFTKQGFTEVETPLLIASTPEGARDFVVPSRLSPGKFYALPQSPQIFKQLLMVGGIDKYFQIAKCLRDEDLRADRQFEFTQLDMEMSFASQEDVLEAVTKSLNNVVDSVASDVERTFDTMTWFEAMDQYGIDKPDLRFGSKLIDVTDVFSATEFRAFNSPCIKALKIEGASDTSRSNLDDLTDKAKKLGAAGLVWMRVKESEIESPVAKFLSETELNELRKVTEAQSGDLLLLVASDWFTTCSVLGTLRNDLLRPPVSEPPLKFLWVTNFPLFEGLNDHGKPVPAHHPFTMPHDEDKDKVEQLSEMIKRGEELDLEFVRSIRSQSYDAVLNGWELGSGSVRIHDSEIQSHIFNILGISEESQRLRFGFLLDAFKFGAPPHAGYAFGIDRLVAILAGEDNIREVSAYPKTQTGHDPLSKAPSHIDDEQLKELGLIISPEHLQEEPS
ncbi:MAG: aspartate--tRNA ligase [Acidimicrobiia bacterium]